MNQIKKGFPVQDNNLSARKFSDDANSILCLKDGIEYFLAWIKKNKSETTYNNYRFSLKPLQLFFGNEKVINSISAEDIDNYKLKKQEERMETRTINHQLRIFSSMCNRLRKLGYMNDFNLRGNLEKLPEKSLRKRKVFISEYKQILTDVDDNEFLIITLLGIFSSLKIFEILSLKAKEVDISSSYIHKTKNNRIYKAFRMPENISSIMKRYLESNGYRDNMELFTYTYYLFRKDWDDILKKENIENLHFYDMNISRQDEETQSELYKLLTNY